MQNGEIEPTAGRSTFYYYGGIADGRELTYVRNHRHGTSTWLRAFASAGLAVVDRVEVPFTDERSSATRLPRFIPRRHVPRQRSR